MPRRRLEIEVERPVTTLASDSSSSSLVVDDDEMVADEIGIAVDDGDADVVGVVVMRFVIGVAGAAAAEATSVAVVAAEFGYDDDAVVVD